MSAVEEGGKTCIFYIGFLHFDDGGIDGPSILKPLQKPQLRRLQFKSSLQPSYTTTRFRPRRDREEDKLHPPPVIAAAIPHPVDFVAECFS